MSEETNASESANGVDTETNWVNPPGTGDILFLNAKKMLEAGESGVILEGKLVKLIDNNFDKQDAKFIRSSDGQTVVINGAGSLIYQLSQVAPGTLCQISYFGMTKMTKGKYKGKDVHDFKVVIAG